MVVSIPVALQSNAVPRSESPKSPSGKRKSKLIEQLIEKKCFPNRESYLYAFVGRTRPPVWTYLVLGPIGAILLKNYQVVIDKESVILARINILGRIDTFDRIPFRDIKSFDWKKKTLINRIRLVLKNGRKITLESNHRALVAMEDCFSTDEALHFVQSRIS